MTLLRFGPDLEVLTPPQLRQAMRDMAASLAQLYAPVPSPAPVPNGAVGDDSLDHGDTRGRDAP